MAAGLLSYQSSVQDPFLCDVFLSKPEKCDNVPDCKMVFIHTQHDYTVSWNEYMMNRWVRPIQRPDDETCI